MNIKEVKTCFKVADAILDKEHGIRHIKFIFLKDIKDAKGTKIDSGILRDESGRIYLIVSNKKIMKIGGSECKGGIKTTMSFYQGGMQGGPSIRTYGIHILIKEELEKNKKVEIYMISSTKAKMRVKGLFSEDVMEVSAFRDMERKCKQDYISREKKLPPWNFQERGEMWRQDILLGLSEHNSKRKSLNRPN
jgi:hypothetical protein